MTKTNESTGRGLRRAGSRSGVKRREDGDWELAAEVPKDGNRDGMIVYNWAA